MIYIHIFEFYAHNIFFCYLLMIEGFKSLDQLHNITKV